ncbi:cytochrome C biogenesis family protein, partial [Vibrio parahaemolyticus V-223/04]
EAKQ